MATNTIHLNTKSVISLCNQRISALDSEFGSKGSITLAGTTDKVTAVVATYQAFLDQQTAYTQKQTEFAQVRAAKNAALAAVLSTDASLKALVIGQFGASSSQAQNFGYAPKPRKVPTSQEKAVAQQKALATRTARGTMGKSERLKIKGVLPSPSSGAPTQTATPASSSPPTGATLSSH